MRSRAAMLNTGSHEVQVLARDIFGQDVLSPVGHVKIDGSPPTVKFSRSGQR